jgi:transcriptional regulator with XRE-family HTH domain
VTKFGELYKELRFHSGLGLRETARLAGYDASYIRKIERGDYVPTSKQVVLSLVKPFKITDKDIEELVCLAHDYHLDKVGRRFI